LNFPFPVKQKQLKSFLGLVNYFRDHVKDISNKVKPLNDIMVPYKKSTSIDWTLRLEECFRDVQESVGKCPKLFYVDLSLPIHLRTDASDYSIGGYIFQLDQQHELPIRFISKALHKAQLNWSTFEKEAFSSALRALPLSKDRRRCVSLKHCCSASPCNFLHNNKV
jgi:hypothetical protein